MAAFPCDRRICVMRGEVQSTHHGDESTKEFRDSKKKRGLDAELLQMCRPALWVV
jgi:hypothetical protein